MADLRTVKLGLTVRNLFEPEFDTPGAGARLRAAPPGPRGRGVSRATDGLIVSLDADLTRTPDPRR